MGDAATIRALSSTAAATATAPHRHAAIVRLTHWLTAVSFFALLLSGTEIVISHPRFYWGEVGNVHTQPLFSLPIPASRSAVATGYSFVLPDQNGWSRSLHFQSAWLVVFTGALYVLSGLLNRHFQKSLFPSRADLAWSALSRVLSNHLRFNRPDASEAWSYNTIQRLAYVFVVFIVFPLMVWTGLAMSPAIASVFPPVVTVFGGHQSARTIHFFAAVFLVIFLITHIVMVCRVGFWSRTRAMITGRPVADKERP